MKTDNKLLAEWFWTDRWMGSSAFLLPQEARGVYREMLTQSWRRGARLPNDHEAIRRATGTTKAEWTRSWPKVSRYWRAEGDDLVPVEDLGCAKVLPGQSTHRPHIPLAVRRIVFQRDGFVCVQCKGESELSLDHLVPRSRSGADTVANLRILCMPCNRRKGARVESAA